MKADLHNRGGANIVAYMEMGVDSIKKRKRLDARAFLNYYCSLAKKPKIPICGGTSPQSPGRMLHAGSDNLEASRLKEQQLVSKIRKSNCKDQSLLEGRGPRWKLLPRSSAIKGRVECEAKHDMAMTNKVVGCEMRGESLSVKPGVRKQRSPIPRRRRKFVGCSTSGSDGGKSNYSNSVGKACNIRMKKLLSNQKDEIHEFRRTKMEKIAALADEHQSMVNITSQKYGETTEKQEELKKLDDIYKAEVKELDLQMDRMITAIGLAQRTSRIKEKQLKDRWLPLSKKKILVGQITSPSSAPLLNSRPEKECPSGSEGNMVDGSDFVVVSNGLLAESGVLSGDGSTIMKPSGDNFPGVGVEVNRPLEGSLSPSFESHGANDMTVPSEKVSYTSFKLISVGENHCEAVVPPFNDDTENIDVGLVDTASQQTRTKDSITNEQPDRGTQQCPLFAQNCSKPLPTLPNRDVQSGENEMEEPCTGGCSSESEGRCALQTTSCVLTQPQTCIITGNSSPLEQPMTCTTQEMRQMDNPLAILSTGTASSCQAGQLQTLLRNIEPSHSHVLPVSQPVAIATTSSQPSITHNLTPNSSCTATSFVRPVLNDYLAGLSSSRPNISPPPTSDPFTNELVRMEMEETEVINVHKEQLELLRSARLKEIEEINAKFNLLEEEVENALVKKKVDMSSHCQKVRANKILAETMAIFASRIRNFKTLLDEKLSSQPHPTPGSGISPRAERTAPPV